MPFNARAFQIFIASPGDVQEEREIAIEVIQRWNDLNAREKSIVLLPIRWETHASPELGSRPQALINRQVLDQCDLVVGIFWTRLGTPTGESASGTVEEIERTGKNGKPVMLYFSNSKVDIDKVDLDEYKRLKSFKTKTYPEGLVESYSSLTEFRDKLSNQLAIKVRDLVTHARKEETQNTINGHAAISIAVVPDPPAQFPESEENTASARADAQPIIFNGKIDIEYVSCVNQNEIPDFAQSEDPPGGSIVIMSGSLNKDYLRELVGYYVERKNHRACRIAIVNNGAIGVTNVALEIVLKNNHGHLRMIDSLPDKPQKRSSSFYITTTTRYFDQNAVMKIKSHPDYWEMSTDISVVQAKRTIILKNAFYLGAILTTKAQLEATVYSTASPPFALHNTIEIEVSRRTMTYQEILRELGENVT